MNPLEIYEELQEVFSQDVKSEKNQVLIGKIYRASCQFQWRIYQMHIAQLKRIYYLDVPAAYSKLNDVFPPLSVRPFGNFFAEADTLPT